MQPRNYLAVLKIASRNITNKARRCNSALPAFTRVDLLAFLTFHIRRTEIMHLKKRNPNATNIRASIKIKLLNGKFDTYEYTVSKSEIQAARIPIYEAATWLMQQNFSQKGLHDCRKKYGIRASRLAEVWATASKISRRVAASKQPPTSRELECHHG